MDSKKPGMLRHLRQKMLPKLLRGKTSKAGTHLENVLDHRMSASVPDIRDMRQEFLRIPPSSVHQQYNNPSYSNPSTPLLKPARGLRGSGSGLKIGVAGGAARRSEQTLNVPTDCTDWAPSQESFSSFCQEEKGSPESIYSPARGMEPEELDLPEMMTVYTPDLPPVEVSQDVSQVQKLHVI